MKKGIIIGLTVIVGIVLVGIVTINVVNTKAESQITSVIEENLKNNEMDDVFKYGDIKVSSTKGSITLSDVDLSNEDMNISASSVEIKLPINEAINLVKNPDNSMITDLKVNIKGVNLISKSDGTKFKQGDLSIVFKGKVNTKIFNDEIIPTDDDFLIEKIELKNSDVIFSSDIGVMSFEDFSLGMVGNIKASDFTRDYDEIGYMALLNIFSKLNLNFEGFKYEAEQEIRQGLSMMAYMFLGEVSFIGNQENWAINKLALDIDIDGNTISIQSLDLVTNWIDFGINASFNLDETLESFTPLNFKLNMNEYIDDLQPFFEMFIGEMTTDEMPEGKFSLSVSMEDMDSLPEVKLEDLN